MEKGFDRILQQLNEIRAHLASKVEGRFGWLQLRDDIKRKFPDDGGELVPCYYDQESKNVYQDEGQSDRIPCILGRVNPISAAPQKLSFTVLDQPYEETIVISREGDIIHYSPDVKLTKPTAAQKSLMDLLALHLLLARTS